MVFPGILNKGARVLLENYPRVVYSRGSFRGRIAKLDRFILEILFFIYEMVLLTKLG